MSTILPFLLVLAGVSSASATPRFGVVTWQSDGSVCATFAEEVPEGAPLKISVFEPQGTIEGTVGPRLDRPCHESAQITGSSYVVVGAEKDSPTDIGIAMVAPAEDVMAKMCASTEGLHLTAWACGRRVWHQYFYLGYDVDPNCTEEEWAD